MNGIIAILIATVIWGAAPPIFKYSLQELPPFTLAFIRFFGAGLLFLPFMIKHGKVLTWNELRDILLGAAWGISINVAFFFLGLQLAPSINVHIIGSLGPIVLYFLSLYMLSEKPHAQLVKGMLISLIGTLVIVVSPFIHEWQKTHTGIDSIALQIVLGNLFFILSMLGGVFIVVYNKKVSRNIHPVLITGMQFLFGAMTFAPFMMYELKSTATLILPLSSWVGIIYGIFFSSAIAYYAQNYALTKMSAQETGLYAYLMPVISIIVAIPLLGKFPDIFFMIGTLFIFFGIFVSERHRKKINK